MHEALSTWSRVNDRNFGGFLRRCGLEFSKGGSPAETNVTRAEVRGKPVALHPLAFDELSGVHPEFRGFFAGNVILVPRRLDGIEYRRDPVAYTSTYNAIVPRRQYELGLVGQLEGRVPYMDEKLVDALVAYLQAPILRYFAAVFGASYMIDKARVERSDLLSFPCPFDDVKDERLLALGAAEDPDEDILDAMAAGSDFRDSYEEFRDFRRHFANAQVPSDGWSPPGEKETGRYLRRLAVEIAASQSSPSATSMWVNRPSMRQTDVLIGMDGTDPRRSAGVELSGRFLGASVVEYDRAGKVVTIAKSPAKHAWTIEQAVADAAAVARSMRTAR